MNTAYRTETESEQEELYLYTVKENNRELIFANIDCVDSDGDKHKIQKLQKNLSTRRQQQNGKIDCHKKGDNYPMGSKRHENTSMWVNNT